MEEAQDLWQPRLCALPGAILPKPFGAATPSCVTSEAPGCPLCSLQVSGAAQVLGGVATRALWWLPAAAEPCSALQSDLFHCLLSTGAAPSDAGHSSSWCAAAAGPSQGWALPLGTPWCWPGLVGSCVEGPDIAGNFLVGDGKVTLWCNMSEPQHTITGHKWIHKEKTLKEDNEPGASTSYTFEGTVEEHSGIYECIFEGNPQTRGQVNISVPPQVTAYKKSEHGNEGDTGVLTCKNPSFPAVTTWSWHKSGHGRLENASGRYIIKSSGNKTELRILKLDIEQDTGDYFCNATNPLGTGDATVNLRVRSRLAALWPFLGIVAEVLVLVTIIFIYEKRRKPDEVPDDDDGGSAPLKSNATNHKDKNVRQRNAN